MSDAFKIVKLLDGISLNITTDGILSNVSGTAPPTVTDDDVAGYAISSHWYDVTNDQSYVAVDVTTGAAVWLPTSLMQDDFVFADDLNTGFERTAADTFEAKAGGFQGFEVAKSTGSFANIGVGGAASTSDNLPLAIERSQTGQTFAQVTNPNGAAGAAPAWKLTGDTGSSSGAEFILHPNAATLDAYKNKAVIRTFGTSDGVNLFATTATGAIGFFIGVTGANATDRILEINAAGDVLWGQEITTPATPSSGTNKEYFKSDALKYRLRDDGKESMSNELNQTATYAYNGDGTVNTITYANGEVDTYAYNGDGSVNTITGDRWTLTIAYNGDGTIASETFS